MDTDELRLECLKLAAALRSAQNTDELIANAEAIYRWLTRQPASAA
jgi:hypothetical protein